jgi:hypothetical protein
METDMLKLRRSLIIALVLTGSAALAQAQTATSAQRAATATDPQSSGPETARDDTKLKPETATDAPKLSATQQAAEQAKQGVRSNTPPSSKP